MFPLNTILSWNINIIMNKKYDNNNIIIASSAYFLQKIGATSVPPNGRDNGVRLGILQQWRGNTSIGDEDAHPHMPEIEELQSALADDEELFLLPLFFCIGEGV
jgi:hypothetical protein